MKAKIKNNEDILGLEAFESLVNNTAEIASNIHDKGVAIKGLAKSQKKYAIMLINMQEKLTRDEKKQINDAFRLMFRKLYGV